MVAYHVTALHRRKDLWGEDAYEFKPERWEKETVSWVWVLLIISSCDALLIFVRRISRSMEDLGCVLVVSQVEHRRC